MNYIRNIKAIDGLECCYSNENALNKLEYIDIPFINLDNIDFITKQKYTVGLEHKPLIVYEIIFDTNDILVDKETFRKIIRKLY